MVLCLVWCFCGIYIHIWYALYSLKPQSENGSAHLSVVVRFLVSDKIVEVPLPSVFFQIKEIY